MKKADLSLNIGDIRLVYSSTVNNTFTMSSLTVTTKFRMNYLGSGFVALGKTVM